MAWKCHTLTRLTWHVLLIKPKQAYDYDGAHVPKTIYSSFTIAPPKSKVTHRHWSQGLHVRTHQSMHTLLSSVPGAAFETFTWVMNWSIDYAYTVLSKDQQKDGKWIALTWAVGLHIFDSWILHTFVWILQWSVVVVLDERAGKDGSRESGRNLSVRKKYLLGEVIGLCVFNRLEWLDSMDKSR